MKILKGIRIIFLLGTIVFLSGCGNSSSKQKTIGNNSPAKTEYYTCTMHPQIRSDKPGVCPICGMELIKKVVDDNSEDTTQKGLPIMVTLGGNKQVLANVSIYKVKKTNLKKDLRAYSYLDFEEQNRKTIAARFNGRLEKMFVDKTGDRITKGQPLFEIYSPDLVQAENEYLIAINNSSRGNNIHDDEKTVKNANSLLNASRKKLELYGLTSDQIKAIETDHDIKLTLTYFSPYSGTVLEKKAQEGMYVNEGSSIYEIADLSNLWDISEINENNLSDIKIGSQVILSVKSFPGEEFRGRVTFIYPLINQQTRTVKVRSEFSSYGGKLKPQMYGETLYQINKGIGILVPADAILFTGKRTVVWSKVSNGVFEPRDVVVGERFDNMYQVLSGLNEGDEIAATGGFLIDSESQLRNGMENEETHKTPESVDTIKRNIKNKLSSRKEAVSESEKSAPALSIIRKGRIDLEKIDLNKDGKVFQDLMDWNVISDQPGRCPICNMKLKEVTIEEARTNLLDHGFRTK